MQLILNNGTFIVTSFTETLSFVENENGTAVAVDLMINIAYSDSLENLVPTVEDLDFANFSIVDEDDRREYAGYTFNGIDQQVSGFHQISTTLRLVKKTGEEATE